MSQKLSIHPTVAWLVAYGNEKCIFSLDVSSNEYDENNNWMTIEQVTSKTKALIGPTIIADDTTLFKRHQEEGK